MAEEIQLVKPDGQEWGFRVTGGVDFGTVLTIVKINRDSTAERYGLKVGDMIIAVNDQPLGHMTHFQATDAISKAGNFFKVSVIRGSIVEVPHLPIPQINVQNGVEEGSDIITASSTECPVEPESLELPPMLENMINLGLKEQEAMEDPISEDQQNMEADEEVAGSWNFTLPQQLVVTLKSVSPSLAGRPASPWEIIEEYNTFVDVPDTPTGASNTPLKITTEINVSATKNEQERAAAVPEGSGQVGQATEVEPQRDTVPTGGTTPEGVGKQEQHKSDGAQSKQVAKTESQGTDEQSAEEHKEYTDDEIAEMMSGCAEVIAGKCMGVDFQKLPPDSDIMKSEVLHALIAERIEYPKKKLTTFQQKPTRPKPKPKGEPEKPPEPYLPLKYKGKKKEVDSSQPDGPAVSDGDEVTPATENVVPESETQHNPDDTHTHEAEVGEPTHEHEEAIQDTSAQETAEDAEHTDETKHQEESHTTQELQDPTVVNSSDIEAQLSEIQSQLAAVIQLPVEIQQHLSFIQAQLSKVLEMRAAAEVKESQEHEEEEPSQEGGEHQVEQEAEERELEDMGEQLPGEAQEETGGEEEEHKLAGEDDHPETEPEPQPAEPEPEPEPEPPQHKKDIQWIKEDETQKRNKPFFPLTPQPRPVKLPGGRHWFQSRDIYTEDFIAETISGKEEVIIGTTIGVDFRKFQCNLDHLQKSSVYKMIHGDEEKKSPGVFASRAEKLLAKEDYINPCDQKG